MSQRTILAATLVLGLLVLALMVGLRFGGTALEGGGVEQDEASRPPVGLEVGPDEGAAALALEAPEALADARREAPEEETTAAEEPQELRWIEGRVQFPQATPADERALVLALSESMSRRALAAAPGLLSDACEGETPSGRLLAKADVDSDGHFRLGVPADVRPVHLALSGRYLYSSATSVEPAPGTAPLLTAMLGAWITGRLVPPPEASGEEAGFDDVELELGPDMRAGFNTTQARGAIITHEACVAQDGSFEFRGISDVIAHGVSVKHEHLAAHLRLGITPVPGEHLELELALVRGATLSGHVVDEEGRPVANADVEVRFQGVLGGALDELREAETDASGAFTLANVSVDGKLELLARHDDYQDGRSKVAAQPRDGEGITGLQVVLVGGGAVEGRVTFDDGSPAPDVPVYLSADLSKIGGMDGMAIARSRGRNTRSAEDGTFAVRGLGDIQYKAMAQVVNQEGDRAGHWRASVRGVKAGGPPVVLTLEKLATVHGRVVDEDGEPVTAFDVQATLEGSGGMFGIGAERRSFDFAEAEGGEFELTGLDSGVWEVEATAEGYARSAPVAIEVPVAEASAPLVLTLAPAANVGGVVLDTADLPVANAHVTLQLGIAERVQADQKGGAPSVFTDAEGRFLLPNLDPGTLQVVASQDGFASSEVQSCVVAPGQTVDDLVLRLRMGGTLTGVVYGDDGEPSPGRMVVVQITPTYTSQHILQSDALGEFRAEHLEPATWQVVATVNLISGEGAADEDGMAELLGNMKMGMVEIFDGEEAHIVLGAPPEDPVALSIQVLASGEPVSGSAVTLVPEGGGGMASLKMGATDSDGRVQLTLDHPGPYLVTVQNSLGVGQQNSTEFLERIPDDVEEHTLLLELPHGRISGSVRGPDGGPLAGCRITLNSEGGMPFGSFLGGQYTEIATAEDGSYDIPHLRPGTYTVSAGGSPLGGLFGAESAGGRVVRGGIALEEGEWLDSIDFRLGEPCEVRGTVLDASGGPANEATIFVRDEEGHVLERFSFTTTDASGAFVCPGLAAGRYSLSARHGLFASVESGLVRVDEGEAADVLLELEPGTVVIVSVQEGSEVPSRPRIRVVDPSGRELSGMLSFAEIMENFGRGFSSEEQRIGPLPPGTYRVTATTADGRTKTKPVTLKGQPERKIKIRLD